MGSRTENLRIVHVIDSAGVGGGERYILDLINHCPKEVTHSVVIPTEGSFRSDLIACGIDCLISPMPLPWAPSTHRRLAQWIRQKGVHLVHTHGYRGNLYGRLAALQTRRPSVATIHVSLFDYPSNRPLRKWLFMGIERLMARRTAVFICISREMQKDAWKLGVDRRRTVLVPNGVDGKRFSPHKGTDALKARFGISPDLMVVGTVGRLVPEKGQRFLIEAMAKLKDEYENTVCLLIGDGPERMRLEKIAKRLDVTHRCRFLGVQHSIERMYPLMDVFVLPSIREPFGLSILEAMASGVPIIATADGGPMDILRHGEDGLLVPPKNSDKVASSIAYLLSNPRYARTMGLRAREKAVNLYGIERTVGRTIACYRRVLFIATEDATETV